MPPGGCNTARGSFFRLFGFGISIFFFMSETVVEVSPHLGPNDKKSQVRKCRILMVDVNKSFLLLVPDGEFGVFRHLDNGFFSLRSCH